MSCRMCGYKAEGVCEKCRAYLCSHCFNNHRDVPVCNFGNCNGPVHSYGRCVYHGNKVMFKGP